MNTYIAELWHGPEMSPLSNIKAREMANRTHARLPSLMAEKGITRIADWHLDPEHRAILIFDAQSVESVRDLLYESGFMHWCDGRVYPATPLSELHKWAAAQDVG